jgi:hypothetical protein
MVASLLSLCYWDLFIPVWTIERELVNWSNLVWRECWVSWESELYQIIIICVFSL